MLDRDDYLKRDARALKIRQAYEVHVARVFTLLGEAPAAAKASACAVLAIETALAKASLSEVDRRDPYKTFHVVDAAGLQALMPGFGWAAFQVAHQWRRRQHAGVREGVCVQAGRQARQEGRRALQGVVSAAYSCTTLRPWPLAR